MIRIIAIFCLLPTLAIADLTHEFKSPAFNGQGYSAHMLSLEQLTFNRQKDIDDEVNF